MIVVYAIFNFLSLLFCILKSQLRELVLQNIDIDDRKSSECWDCGGCFIYMVCLLYSTNNIVLFLVVVFVSSIIIFIWFNALLFLKKKIIVVLGKIKTKIIDPSFLRKIKLCCELRFRYSFVHKLLHLIYDNVLVDLWLGLFVPCDSMTINGWEMMIPLAFFAGTG